MVDEWAANDIRTDIEREQWSLLLHRCRRDLDGAGGQGALSGESAGPERGGQRNFGRDFGNHWGVGRGLLASPGRISPAGCRYYV